MGLLATILARHYWQTKRRIVVFESDDWGSIRMPSKDIYYKSITAGLCPDSNPYTKFDSLESSEDLNSLFDVLTCYKDYLGNHPSITANFVITNPDFEKIRQSGYKSYFYENFTTTFERYYPNERVFGTLKQGIEQNIWVPQFHGREHVNVFHWLKLLNNSNQLIKKAFDFNYWGIPYELYSIDSHINLQATYDALNFDEAINHKESILKGLIEFENIFGYKSKSFIPNNFIFDKEFLKETLLDNGVFILQGMKYHKKPKYGNKRVFERRKVGIENELVNLVRNVDFEPSQEICKTNVVNVTVNEIENAFFWKKPAIINTHRLNFIGSIVEENRRQNLNLLSQLLKKILLTWPDVIFFNSVQLGEYIMSNNKNYNK